MERRIWKAAIIGICMVCFLALGMAYAQEKKVGGGDVKYAGASSGPVVFSHANHTNQAKSKCTDCHTKVFKMKKEAKISKDDHSKETYCGTCHNGKKAFGQTADADCAKCHKK